jgi:flagellar biosynthesis anti-sigma factor FlgM
MKIQNEGGSSPLIRPGVTARKSPASKHAGAVPSKAAEPAADTATTSGLAATLETDAQRAARVERLREQVQAGTYSVDARELSKRLIDAHLSEPTVP